MEQELDQEQNLDEDLLQETALELERALYGWSGQSQDMCRYIAGILSYAAREMGDSRMITDSIDFHLALCRAAAEWQGLRYPEGVDVATMLGELMAIGNMARNCSTGIANAVLAAAPASKQ